MATNGTATSAVLTGLAGGTAAQFSVVAENGCGTGPATDTSAVTPTGPGTTYASTVIADGPSAYYRLSEPSGKVMADSSGLAQDGSFDTGVKLGRPGALLSDPGAPSVNDSVGLGTSPASLPQFADPRSVSAWVNTAAAGNNPAVAAWGTAAKDQAFIVGIGPSAITVDGYNDYHYFATSHPVADGTWHFVTVTYDGSAIEVYLDGQLQGTARFRSRLATFGSSLALGAGPNFGYSAFVGRLQDIAVYPVALSASQISAQYAAAGYALPPAPPVAHAGPGGANGTQISWGNTANPGEPNLSYTVTAISGPDAGMSVSAPGDATAVKMSGLAPGASQFTVTAFNASGPSPASTTNAFTVPGAAATYASTIRAAGPDVFYRLGDGSLQWMSDSSGNGATGTYAPDATLDAAGPLASDATPAVTVGGQTGAVGTAGGVLPLYNSPRTAEAWFNTTAPAGNNGYSYQTLLAWGGTGTEQAFTVGVSSSAITVDGGNDPQSFATPYAVNDGNWHFVAVTYDGSAITVYLDGVQIGTGRFSAQLNTRPPSVSSTPPLVGLYLGQAVSTDGSTIAPLGQGSLADVAVFPSALSGTQVAAQFAASGLSRPTAPSGASATAGTNQATVTWSASGPVESYIITALAGGTTAENSVAVNGSATSAVVGGLVAGVSYSFQVAGVNAYGTGAPAVTGPVSPTGSGSTYSGSVLADGATAYYRLSDSTASVLTDSSGKQANGTYISGNATLGTAGAIHGDPSTGITLQNSQTAAEAPATLPLYNSPRTVEAWFNMPTGSTTSGTLVGWGQPGADQGFDVQIGPGTVTVDAGNDAEQFTTPTRWTTATGINSWLPTTGPQWPPTWTGRPLAQNSSIISSTPSSPPSS